MSETIDLIRKYPMTRSLDTVARELFNALGQAKEWEVTKTPEQNSYIFTVKRKEKLISKLTPSRFLVRLSEEQGYCVVLFENQDQEPVFSQVCQIVFRCRNCWNYRREKTVGRDQSISGFHRISFEKKILPSDFEVKYGILGSAG